MADDFNCRSFSLASAPKTVKANRRAGKRETLGTRMDKTASASQGLEDSRSNVMAILRRNSGKHPWDKRYVSALVHVSFFSILPTNNFTYISFRII